MKLWRKYSCALLFTAIALLQAGILYAQQRFIYGKITNEMGETLPSASISLLNRSFTVVSFAISKKSGNYFITLPDTLPLPCWLEVNYLGYKKQRQQVSGALTGYNFTLQADTAVLKDITVKNRAYIEQLGDTLRYLVNNFAQKEDRSIGDVIRRLPGVDVADDGTIYFNGRKVENLYIQGDDLMSGRYGLATKTIRKEQIENIDIIRNHQPIQVLKDKIFSDQTAINLILKDENSFKVSTEVMAGAGLPEQYDASVSPILLNKKIKMVNTIGVNNSGVDYKNDIKQLGSSNFIANIGAEAARVDLSAGTIGPPDLPLANYYFNRSGIINLNELYNMKNGFQLKTNIQGFLDRNTLEYSSLAENFLPDDTISYHEQQRYTDKPWQLYMSFNVMANKSNYFFNNNTQVNLNGSSNLSYMSFDQAMFDQLLHKKLNEFSNDMTWTPAVKGKGVAEFRWLLRYTYDKQLLDIGNGYVPGIPGQEEHYNHTYQAVKLPTLFSNAYLSYRIPGGLLSQEYRLGYTAERQQLQSALDFDNGGALLPYQGDDGNNLKWNRNNIYFSPEYQLKYENWRAAVQLPVTYQFIRYYQFIYNLDDHNNRLLFNPAISLRYDLGPEQSLTAGYHYANAFGNISNVFRGGILENYRTFQLNDAELQERNTNSYSLNYDYQQSIIMLFFNLGISYDRINANTIFSTDISDSIQKNVLLPYKNTRSNFSLNAGFSKYVFWLQSTLSLKTRLKRFTYQQLINSGLYPFHGYQVTLSGNVNRKMGVFQVSYQPATFWNTSKIAEKNPGIASVNSTIFQLDQNLSFSVTALKQYYLELNARHRFTSQTGNTSNQNFFMDIKLQRSKIWKDADLSLNISNIFNVQDYTLYNISANQLLLNRYRIRGRMAILRLDFYF